MWGGEMTVIIQSSRPASAPEPTDAEVDNLLQLGLPNHWYAIVPSGMVTDKPVAVRRFGQKLAVWRDTDNRVHVQADRCPHRGAPLSLADHLGDRLRCIYHGVEVDGSGRVVSVPGMPGCALEGRLAVPIYPAREVKGAVFAWYGDALHREPGPFKPPIELQDDGPYEAFLCYYEWKAPWRSVYDNNMDPMHGAFLHEVSYTMSQGDKAATFRTRDTDTGFIFEKVGQRNVNFDASEWCDTGAMYCRLDIPYPMMAGPGGNLGIIFMGTPVDAVTMAGFSWRCRRVEGWQRDLWRFMYKMRLNAPSSGVLEQDRAVLEATEPDAMRHEMLYGHDVGLVKIRRTMASEAHKQLIELKTAGAA
jgi:phenylpropionate dioxygenase-like ring-hydroxylating dioxygenase large terminal subunit